MTGLKRDDVATLASLGAIVAITASLAHEALGHGLGCVADGGSVTLITFLVFRCDGAGALADGAGPFGALLIGVLSLAVLGLVRPRSAILRVFLLTSGAITVFWFCAQTVRESIDLSDDWGHLARDLDWPSWWRVVAGSVGGLGYLAAIFVLSRLGRSLAGSPPSRLVIPYVSTVICAVCLGALWRGDSAGSALDAFMSFGLAPLGYIFVIQSISRAPTATAPPIERNYLWIGGGAALFVIFALTVARGLGPLAGA